MMFSENEVYGIEDTKIVVKKLIDARGLLWNGITRNVVVAGGVFTSLLQKGKFKDIDIFVLNNDIDVYHNLTQGFTRQEMAGPNTRRIADDLTGQKEWSRSEIVKYNYNPSIVDVINNNHTKAQYILTKYETREELLAHFDYKHCKVSYVPEDDKLYINRETFDCIKLKVLKWNNKQDNNPNQIYRKNKYLNEGWVLETPNEALIDPYANLKNLTTDRIKAAYDEIRKEVVKASPMHVQKSYLDEILESLTNPTK